MVADATSCITVYSAGNSSIAYCTVYMSLYICCCMSCTSLLHRPVRWFSPRRPNEPHGWQVLQYSIAGHRTNIELTGKEPTWSLSWQTRHLANHLSAGTSERSKQCQNRHFYTRPGTCTSSQMGQHYYCEKCAQWMRLNARRRSLGTTDYTNHNCYNRSTTSNHLR